MLATLLSSTPAGSAVLLDGGLGTTLAATGHDCDGATWVSGLLLDAPDAVAAAHASFLTAGSRVVTTASYQLAAQSLVADGRDPDLLEVLLPRSVELARRAVDEHVAAGGAPAAVAASVGPYGAAQADGSEYVGYAADVDLDVLLHFHDDRLRRLLDARPDVLACETIPSAAEVAALARLLDGTGVDAWIAVTLGPDGTTVADGTPLLAALAPALEVDEVIAVGVNCSPPERVVTALRVLADADRPLVLYPNVGDRWDAGARRWVRDHEPELAEPMRWIDAGARLIGGCCGTAPADIARLAGRLTTATPAEA